MDADVSCIPRDTKGSRSPTQHLEITVIRLVAFSSKGPQYMSMHSCQMIFLMRISSFFQTFSPPRYSSSRDNKMSKLPFNTIWFYPWWPCNVATLQYLVPLSLPTHLHLLPRCDCCELRDDFTIVRQTQNSAVATFLQEPILTFERAVPRLGKGDQKILLPE